MTALFFLIPISLAMGLIGLAAFIWSVGSGQYEDLAGAAERVLLDHDDALLPMSPSPPATSASPSAAKEEAPS